ncbi:DEAD/DEAH box helicase [Paenibacillus thalictri]|uniref:DEAD/DEAH box helicase n=1 Tax=Paenibacillus thalictri TaxID=2527873 RepID=A0A4V2J3X3_9BACL|nr:DEAD/DEAH box helicase [Paenibacillus thalictri]TBL76130.1 DEAD/DEAH box helicase [Paenibacillus thalictri]
MSAFELLSPKIKKAIWDLKWPALRPIQEVAIPLILETTDHLVLSAATASGKTEAAFLPILSAIEQSGQDYLRVLYIAPLKALINDQFERIERLCEYVDVPVHKWHGDVSGNDKKKFINTPAGILQITPESLESLFINRSTFLQSLWKQVSYIVIDEIHVFLATERGAQLRSLLFRVQEYVANPTRIIGLSATVNDPDGYIANWLSPEGPDQVKVIQSDDGDKEIFYALHHYPNEEQGKLPLELYRDIRDLTKEYSSMIFANDRGLVEETAVLLNRLAEHEGAPRDYLAHHSSIDKSEREYVEEILKTANRPKSVVCTATLELGIDIGSMDMVIQIDSTFSVASLKQRIGRTGRRDGMSQILQIYTTKASHLLHAVAVTELFLEKWVEPPQAYAKPYDVLFHQILSICCERNGLYLDDLMDSILRNPVFQVIPRGHIVDLVDHMIKKEYLELVPGAQEFIVGLEGERILRSREFYSVFSVQEEYEVFHLNRRIGAVDKTPAVEVGNNLILAGKLWSIESVDSNKDKIYVVPAVDAKRPVFLGSGGAIHRMISEKMQEVLCSNHLYSYLNDAAAQELKGIREVYARLGVMANQRVIIIGKNETLIELFAGTVISNTLMWMLRVMGVEQVTTNGLGHIKIVGRQDGILKLLESITKREWNSQELLSVTFPQEIYRTKFSFYLNEEQQKELHVSAMVDVERTVEFLSDKQFIVFTC